MFKTKIYTMNKNLLGAIIVLILIPVLYCNATQADSLYLNNHYQLKIRFAYTEEISKTPLSGRLILGFQKNTSKFVNNPDPMDPQPTFAWDIKEWKPGESVVLDSKNALSWKGDLDSLDGWYCVQAYFKANSQVRGIDGAGNALTIRNIILIEKGNMCRPVDLLFTRLLTGPGRFKETEFIKEIKIDSKILAEFYGKRDTIYAAVILPKSYYKEPEKVYPTVYVLSGWGATHYDGLAEGQHKRYGMYGFGEEKIYVFANHECRTGYHEFCNSENNGPREETFFRELLPYIEKNFRVDKRPVTRFLMGQSSGAWAGLWLLINYPDQFGGAFVSAPDPVDFTEFNRTNIYEKNANIFYYSDGKIKYPFRNSFQNVSNMDFLGIDRIAGWGEQFYSWDATFSTKDENGQPKHLFNWETGIIDPLIADSWKKYDLSRVVSNLEKKNKKLLEGKIHIYVANNDDFGLDVPVRAFSEIMVKEGIGAQIIFLPEGGHFGVWTDDLRNMVHNEIDNIVHGATAKKAK